MYSKTSQVKTSLIGKSASGLRISKRTYVIVIYIWSHSFNMSYDGHDKQVLCPQREAYSNQTACP